MTIASRGSKVVFVGNIPYDMSEEQLIHVFREVGPVAGFRLVFDRDSGKPKGYGFCEFLDPETAASAVRNLNDVDVGGRPLRIDFAETHPLHEGKTTSMGQFIDSDYAPPRDYVRRDGRGDFRGGGGPHRHGGGGGGGDHGVLPPGLPMGIPVPPGVKATDSITNTLANMPPNQLLDIMSQMKSLVMTSPEQARALLSAHPQLAYALFQAMLMMNVVDSSILQRILAASASAATSAPAPQPGPGPTPSYATPPGPAAAAPRPPVPNMDPRDPRNRPGAAPGAPPGPPPMPPQAAVAGYGTPPVGVGYGGAALAPPPPQHVSTPPQAQAQPPPAQNQPQLQQEQHRQLLMQVLQLTPEQINNLPPDQRASILQLKAQLGQSV